jgi:DNA-binding NarL/FixJ family response regulator
MEPVASKTERTRVLLVSGHRGLANGLSELLRTYPDLDVVGRVATLARALPLAGELAPDVIVVDRGAAPGEQRGDLLAIRRCSPETRVVFLTLDPDVESASRGSATDEIVVMGCAPAKVIEAIRRRSHDTRPTSPTRRRP